MGLIALTLQEIRRLLIGLSQRFHRPLCQAQILAWSCWRRHHQDQARKCHQNRRALKQSLIDLQL